MAGGAVIGRFNTGIAFDTDTRDSLWLFCEGTALAKSRSLAQGVLPYV